MRSLQFNSIQMNLLDNGIHVGVTLSQIVLLTLTLFIMLTFFLIIEKRQSDHKKLPNWGQRYK